MSMKSLAALAASILLAASVSATATSTDKPAGNSVSRVPSVVQDTDSRTQPIRVAQARETCFKTGEKTDGMNKICYYRCNSGEAAITISSVSLCPLSIQR
jgi:hypothetical protein